ncbi:8-oxo-dGTP pyrophosphatase MutT (NUDIX family) [Fictibacillus halophilus]|uniref:8-oxo-dGTP pyrophosphatase MutT (NUDIX family) n=1 Tax=Fictibacillus halophilus TaxID=1610490 RepID=A0ABV2LHD8_9BACL|nr:NUDIX domain-containing protein [Fictibacillus halophilus]
MYFKKTLEDLNSGSFKSSVHREAVRAIIMKNNHILLVQSNRGDYKFPGGGVEENETQSDGLIREVREETGYSNCIVKDKVGIVIERNINEFDSDVLFQMTSHYYLCDLLNEEKVTQQLDEYEFELDFTPKWVSLDDAINQNENLIKEFEKNSWLRREAFVLKELKNRYYPTNRR